MAEESVKGLASVRKDLKADLDQHKKDVGLFDLLVFIFFQIDFAYGHIILVNAMFAMKSSGNEDFIRCTIPCDD